MDAVVGVMRKVHGERMNRSQGQVVKCLGAAGSTRGVSDKRHFRSGFANPPRLFFCFPFGTATAVVQNTRDVQRQ